MQRLWKRFRPILRVLVPLVTAAFTLAYLVSQWDQVAPYAGRIEWAGVILATLGFVVGMWLWPFGPALILRYRGQHIPYAQLYYGYALSQVAKYLPGGVWSLPVRVVFYERQGVPAGIAVNTLTTELVLMIEAAALIAAVGLAGFLPSFHYVMLLIAVGGLLVIWATGLTLKSRPSWSTGWVGKLLSKLATLRLDLSLRQTVTLLAFYVATWAIFGVSFVILARAVGMNMKLIETPFLYWIALFATAWTLGFLAIFAPGGIGVREGVLIAGISVIAGSPLPFIVAIVGRVMWMLAEFIGLAISYGFTLVQGLRERRHVMVPGPDH